MHFEGEGQIDDLIDVLGSRWRWRQRLQGPKVGGEHGVGNMKTWIVPRHIWSPVRNGEVMIAKDGVLPNIHNMLLQKKASLGSKCDHTDNID
ncbi:hypothetical protein CRG98_025497 [Punica granatum]|uniref:Histone H2A C-terminal domain-containing protein n=1 Tax=Punica granatum TaxID=22663 RepID=A0A2I0JCY6_PUNGR|nr:hypothetical protein CRG98_025497 [Punica granatum]